MGGAPYKSAKEGGWALFQVLPHLTMKECPCHVYALKANSWTNSFEVKAGQPITL